ncbi:hypothetical protein P2A65_21935, partial [Xanthomonas perforans]|uniref:hypothetical protein n=1 Tax=Xanthomonas perforans TaxID=442694 RepID=UPI001F1D03B2
MQGSPVSGQGLNGIGIGGNSTLRARSFNARIAPIFLACNKWLYGVQRVAFLTNGIDGFCLLFT